MTYFRVRYAAIAAAVVTAGSVALSLGTAAAAPVRPARQPAALPVVKVAMDGKSIAVSGSLQSGGVQIVSTVTKEPAGSPTFVRLDPGVTIGELLSHFKQISADPNNLDGLGAIVLSAQSPRGTSVVEVSLAAGQYLALDLGAHSKVPPFTPFVITKSSSPAKLPSPAATVSSIEFAFRGPAVLHDGQLVRFRNAGFLVHMIVAARASSAAKAHEIAALLKAGKDRQAQRLADGFATFDGGLSHGAFQQLVVRSRPGFWVLACFMDTQDHREHTTLGMERVIRITG
jgi:hypothetical protein